MQRILRGKRGIDLSINFIVVMILAIVVFGIGIMLLRTIFTESTELLSSSYDDIDRQIADFSCQPGERVCISPRDRRIDPGELGVFGLNIINTLPQEQDFEIVVVPTHNTPSGIHNGKFNNREVLVLGYGENNGIQVPILYKIPCNAQDCISNEQLLTVIYRNQKFTIKPQEKQKIGIGVEVPRGGISKGEYVLDVYVFTRQVRPDPFKCSEVCAASITTCRNANILSEFPCWNTYGGPDGALSNVNLYGGQVYKIFVEVP